MSLPQMGTQSAWIAATSFPQFLKLPGELRNEVYEQVLFDFPAPDMARLLHAHALGFQHRRGRPEPWSIIHGRINTNILLTNRGVFNEARYIIITRAQLVSIEYSHGLNLDYMHYVLRILRYTSIPILPTRYNNFCVMTHSVRFEHIQRNDISNRPFHFIICRRDLDLYCRGLMGECPYKMFGGFFYGYEYTLLFRDPFMNREHLDRFPGDEVQAKLLKPYETYMQGRFSIGAVDSLPLNQHGADKVVKKMRKQRDNVWIPDPATFRDELQRLLEVGEATLARDYDDDCTKSNTILVLFIKAYQMCARVLGPYPVKSWPLFAPSTRSKSGYRESILDLLSELHLIMVKDTVDYAVSDYAGDYRCRSWVNATVDNFLNFFHLEHNRLAGLAGTFDTSDWVPRPSTEAATCFWMAHGIRVISEYAGGQRDILLDAQLGYCSLKRAIVLHCDLGIEAELEAYRQWTRTVPGFDKIKDQQYIAKPVEWKLCLVDY